MSRLRFIPKGGAGNTELTRKVLNQVILSVNKLKGDEDGDGLGENNIPVNVYPVADGAGGLLAGKIKIVESKKAVAIGHDALSSLDYDHAESDANTAVGYRALQWLTTGQLNTAFGATALSRVTVQSGNTGVGRGALSTLESSSSSVARNNTAVGDVAGNALTTGSNNTFIGSSAGSGASQKVNATNSIAIGESAVTTKNNQAVIGNNTTFETVIRGNIINTLARASKDTTATLTAVECLSGVITSTSVAAVSLTLPTAAALLAEIHGGASGSNFELIIDNSAGANSVTIVPSATIAAITSPFTVTDPMIVTTAQKVGCFKFYFTSATAAVVARVW